MSKRILSRYLPTLLNRQLATFMMVGKRKQYYTTPKRASLKKALQHEYELQASLANLDAIPMPNIVPNGFATLAVYNLTQERQSELKTLTADFTKKFNQIVKG